MATTRVVIKSAEEACKIWKAGLLLYDDGYFGCAIGTHDQPPTDYELVNGWLYYLVEEDEEDNGG